MSKRFFDRKFNIYKINYNNISKDMRKIEIILKSLLIKTARKIKEYRFRKPKNVLNLIAPLSAILILILTVNFWQSKDFGLLVKYKGQAIATVKNEETFNQASVLVMSRRMVQNNNKCITPQYELTDVGGNISTITSMYYNLVNQCQDDLSDGCGLFVNNNFLGAVKNKSDLDAILNAAKAEKRNNGIKNAQAIFYDSVQTVNGLYPTKSFVNIENMAGLVSREVKFAFTIQSSAQKSVPFKIVKISDNNKFEDYSQVKKQGVIGKENCITQISYMSGKKVKSNVISEQVTKAPVDEVLIVGTKKLTAGVATGTFAWPVPYSHIVSSVFGPRFGAFHSGVDIAGPNVQGQDINASDGGTVTFAGMDDSGYGNCVIIEHGKSYKTLYGHASMLYVHVGEKVKKGQKIASVGMTGDADGYHLHFEIWKNNVKVDPLGYLNYKYTIDESE